MVVLTGSNEGGEGHHLVFSYPALCISAKDITPTKTKDYVSVNLRTILLWLRQLIWKIILLTAEMTKAISEHPVAVLPAWRKWEHGQALTRSPAQ